MYYTKQQMIDNGYLLAENQDFMSSLVLNYPHQILSTNLDEIFPGFDILANQTGEDYLIAALAGQYPQYIDPLTNNSCHFVHDGMSFKEALITLDKTIMMLRNRLANRTKPPMEFIPDPVDTDPPAPPDDPEEETWYVIPDGSPIPLPYNSSPCANIPYTQPKICIAGYKSGEHLAGLRSDADPTWGTVQAYLVESEDFGTTWVYGGGAPQYINYVSYFNDGFVSNQLDIYRGSESGGYMHVALNDHQYSSTDTSWSTGFANYKWEKIVTYTGNSYVMVWDILGLPYTHYHSSSTWTPTWQNRTYGTDPNMYYFNITRSSNTSGAFLICYNPSMLRKQIAVAKVLQNYDVWCDSATFPALPYGSTYTTITIPGGSTDEWYSVFGGQVIEIDNNSSSTENKRLFIVFCGKPTSTDTFGIYYSIGTLTVVDGGFELSCTPATALVVDSSDNPINNYYSPSILSLREGLVLTCSTDENDTNLTPPRRARRVICLVSSDGFGSVWRSKSVIYDYDATQFTDGLGSSYSVGENSTSWWPTNRLIQTDSGRFSCFIELRHGRVIDWRVNSRMVRVDLKFKTA